MGILWVPQTQGASVSFSFTSHICVNKAGLWSAFLYAATDRQAGKSLAEGDQNQTQESLTSAVRASLRMHCLECFKWCCFFLNSYAVFDYKG